MLLRRAISTVRLVGSACSTTTFETYPFIDYVSGYKRASISRAQLMENCESRSSISSFRGGGGGGRVTLVVLSTLHGSIPIIKIGDVVIILQLKLTNERLSPRSWNVSRTLFALINASSLTVSMSGIMRDISRRFVLFVYIYSIFLSFCFFPFFLHLMRARVYYFQNYLITLNNVTDRALRLF